MGTTLVGLIAEDESDADVVNVLMSKLARKVYSIKPFLGHGCGKVRGKCQAWATDLKSRGCSLLLVFHDLDSKNLHQLQTDLRAALGVSPIAKHIIVIPVREIEAWLLADHAAINRAVKAKKPAKKIANPEALPRPKEYLRDLITRITERKTVYLNTLHNKRIAVEAAVPNLARCTSFRPFRTFVEAHLR